MTSRSETLAAVAEDLSSAHRAIADQLDQTCLDLGRAVIAEGLTDAEGRTDSFLHGLVAGSFGEAIDWEGDRLYFAGYAKGWDDEDDGDDDGMPDDPEPVDSMTLVST